MIFKKADLNDLDALNNVLSSNTDLSCENTLANIILWSDVYDTDFCIENGVFYQKFGKNSSEIFSLPSCTDIKYGVDTIKNYCFSNGLLPKFWAADGKLLEEFKKYYEDEYDIYEVADSFEYIYNKSDLAELKGKKYHSKRNFITSFTKKYNWIYEDITEENKDEVIALSDEWYSKNISKHSKTLFYEKKAIKTLINNLEKFSAVGGIIRVDGKPVAFSLATKINERCYDVNFEKALPEFSSAYTVINNELAKRLNCELINREDDLGIEGLRRAKLSYHPTVLLKKYICMPKWVRGEAIKLHLSAFPKDTVQDVEIIFNRLYPQNYYYKLVDNKIVSQMFVIDGNYESFNTGYIYAAATNKDYRGKGYMSALIKETKDEFDILSLKPANDSLYDFYKKIGFKTILFANNISGSEIDLTETTELVRIEDVDQFKMVRLSLQPQNSIRLNNTACELAMDLYSAVCDELQNPNYFALYYIEDGRLIISELLSKSEGIYDFIGSICRFENVKKYEVRIPGFDKKDGMIFFDSTDENELPENIYLGITFD